MKSISFLLFFFGIILIVIGYYRNFSKQSIYKEIEYRYLPMSIYSEQIQDNNVNTKFKKMFEDKTINT